MKTKLTFAAKLLTNHKVGRGTPCAPQVHDSQTARRGLPRPTTPRSWSVHLFGVHPSGCQPPSSTLKREHRTTVLLFAALATGSLLMLCPVSAHAQGGVPLWTNVSSGAFGTGWAPALAVDSSNNIFVGGAALTKYSGAGTPLWTNLANGVWSIAVDQNGNAFAFATGNGFDCPALLAYSSAGVPLWTNCFPGLAFALAVDGSGNVFGAGDATIKYSNAGVPIWTNKTPFVVYPNAMAVDDSGNVFVTGNSSSYYATIKYSNAGVPLWTNRYNLGVPDQTREVRAIALDGNGNVFLTGDANTKTDYDYGTLAYSNSGAPLWTNRYDGPAHNWDVAKAIAVDANGNVFVTGYSTTAVSPISHNALYDYATIKYSNSGVPLWTNYYDGPAGDLDYASAIAVDAAGNVFVTGYSADGPCCPFIAALETIAYSNAGDLLWENRYYGPDNLAVFPTDIAVDRAGNVIVTGYSWDGSTYYNTTIKYSSSLPPPVQLDFQRLNNQLVLSWTNAGFTLQTAPAVTGPFTNLPAATSPYTNSLTAPQQFFRLIGN